ncbi:related to 3-dehydroshikimate dehydratase [Melanopsichium pennsylvanicum]|uniref:Related to 3-dehydroshikimate dehydratase n=2 Tax=Melanopsichium pennsylvanicum TaxID=63383 RepID=A0AAJ5C813_9BASI|nr:related to 3-dehydroshikimate dehydratase [Melanopsichium pennsylvanicum 4]SNX87496.1 related to 3-dehydroshikimate dehydratase [Melanopsichium pennsylvanicum]
MSNCFTPSYSIFTHSVGYHTASHSLLTKLNSIASAGINGVEIFTDDLYHFSQSAEFASILASKQVSALLTPPDSPLSQHAALRSSSKTATAQNKYYGAFGECTNAEAQLEIAAAEHIKTYCDHLGLEIVCLQPLRDVEGWVSTSDRANAMERVKSRFPIMQALNTNLLLICSNNTPAPATTGDHSSLVCDLTQISDMAFSFTQSTGHPIRVGFEALSWGSHIDLWAQAWSVVKATNRVNIGLILDSFNTLAREFADPCSSTAIQEPSTITRSNLALSFKKIVAQVPGDKIFLLQIGDAKKLNKALQPSPREGEPRPSRMIWSRSSRLFPCEKERGAFMPVEDFVKAVCDAGYTGPWSIEVFNDSLSNSSSEVPILHARRARAGLDKLVEAVYH